MRFSGFQIDALSNKVCNRLSRNRYAHTLGVKNAAVKISSYFKEIDASEIAVAALLHDITKEYSEAEQKSILLNSNYKIESDDLASSAVLHSLTAPYKVISDFKDYITDNVLSSVKNHTLGDPNMSIFDEIVFLADYVEDGRTYQLCVEVREDLYRELNEAESFDKCLAALHRATVSALSNTVSSLKARGKCVHYKTLATLEAFVIKLKDMEN